MSILPKLIHKFKLNKLPLYFQRNLDMLILQFIWKNKQLALPSMKTNCRETNKTEQYWHTNRYTDQCKRIEHSEKKQNPNGNLVSF